MSRYNYNLFHSLADGVSIVIAACAFTIIWNSRRLVDNNYHLYVGIAFLFFAFLDSMHLLGNKDMGIFPEYGNLGPTFYIASRYVLSVSLLIAPVFINRKLNTTLMFTLYSLVTILILLSIFYWKIFPACIVEGVGLTPFKIVSDYIICLILLGAIGLLAVNRQSFDFRVLRLIISSIILFIATGLTFSLYTDPFGITNLVGHLFQVASFYLVYLAFIETSVTKPQEILYRKLKQHEEELTNNLQQLDLANVGLQKEIAERKRVEDALRRNEEFLGFALETIHTGAWDLDLVDHSAFRSLEHDRIFGYNQLLPKWTYEMFLKHVLPEDRKKVEDEFHRAMENQSDWNFECRIRRTDGRVRWIWAVGRQTPDPTAVSRRMIGIVQDITARKKAEITLNRSLERIALISDTASQLLISQTPQLIIEDLCRKVMDHLDCHLFFNFLIDGERNCLRLNAYAGIPEETARKIHFLDYGVAVCGCAARDACRIVAENIPTTPDIRTELVRSFGITAYACHPLFAQGQVIGTLSFGTKSRLTFTDDELSLMKTVADQVATAMERIRLLRSAEERGDELETKVLERTAQLTKQADLLDLSHDAVILIDMDGRITFWNKGAIDTYGFAREDAIGKLVRELLQTEPHIPFKDIIDIVTREGRWEGELVHTRKDGKKVTVHSRWVLRHDEATGSWEIMEVNRDITARKLAEKALAMISAYNRSLIEASIDPLVTINSQGMISDVNIATERVTGYQRDKLIGTDFCDYFTDPTKAKAVYEQVFREETVRDYELEILHKDGRTTPVLYNASVYRDEAGKVVGVLAAARDITERKYMEQILRESEERYRTAIESASDGVALMRGNQHIYVNKRFAEMFGYSSPSEILGKPHSLTVHPDDLAMVSQINIMRQNGEPAPSRYEFRGIRKDGSQRNIEVSATMINYREEPVSLVYLRDITDYKNLEEQLRQSQKMEAIGTLAGGIAHDFNNILAAVIGFAEMVEEDLPPGSPDASRMQRVLKAASRGRDLVKQILAFSRKTELTRKPLSLSPVVEETVQLLRASLPSTIDINLSIKAAKNTVLASPTELQQVVMNLATNAFFAMRDKGGTLSISVTNNNFEPGSPVPDEDVEPGEYVHLTVTDTGIGMTPGVMKRVFDPFFTTKEVGQGTGMGLAVVYGIVMSLGGTIAVESEPGVGSTFRVSLPVARTDEKLESSKVLATPKGTERILFVDDEELLTEWGQAVLERLGYKVTALTDSTKALNLFSSDPSHFDLVILDQTMPKLTGLQLARKLLDVQNNIPIILCTGHSDSVSPEKAKAAGIKEFLMKPLGKQQLAVAIRRVLNTTESED